MRAITAPGTVPGNLTVGGSETVAGGETVTGNLVAAVLKTTNANGQVFEAASGALLQLQQMSAAPAGAGGSACRLAFVPGTTGSKLVIVAPGGAVFTLQDNIL